jgi:hypothetical protein
MERATEQVDGKATGATVLTCRLVNATTSVSLHSTPNRRENILTTGDRVFNNLNLVVPANHRMGPSAICLSRMALVESRFLRFEKHVAVMLEEKV